MTSIAIIGGGIALLVLAFGSGRAVGLIMASAPTPIRGPGTYSLTFANVDDLIRDVGFKPNTSIDKGIASFVTWYRDFYNA